MVSATPLHHPDSRHHHFSDLAQSLKQFSLIMASSSSSSSHLWTYDVFVSFRGEDIRKSFMDHLFADFRRKGIHAFRDDQRVKRGEEISNELYQAIESSRFLVVIFSENYASSTWCLKELVKILDCKEKEKDQYEVRTIFYDVKPTVVRNQTGSYAKAFEKHEASKKMEVSEWKRALVKAADLSGWDLEDTVHGYESKFIDLISKEIFENLSNGPLDVGENLVGLHSRAEQMNLLQFIGSTKVHMIGICGIGGIGKTTIARAIYNLMYINFEGSCFCEDVKGVAYTHGLVHLQQQLLDDITKSEDLKIRSVGQGISVIKKMMRSKRVLIVLDNVDHRSQFEALAGMPSWFGPGSVVIFTGKDKQLLTAHGAEEIYEVPFLNEDESLELFSLYAFREKYPKDDFIELSYDVVQYVKGHPLALKVLGCFLFSKSVREWKSELDKLQCKPNIEIQQVLRLSYDGLDQDQRNIFLDIACFFKGEDRDFVARILDGCDLFSDTNLRVLVDNSLITVSRNRLQMHDLLQEMGWAIVREESEDPGKRSRLWDPKDTSHVLEKAKGTEAVKGLIIHLSSTKVQIGCETFTGLNNLRILKLYYDLLQIPENSRVHNNIISEEFSGNRSQSQEFLSNELRWLYWHGYPFELLPSTFYPQSLVALNMSYSHIKQLWTGSMSFEKLTLMELRHCHKLIKTPNFMEIPNLEELILEGCTNLVELHPSVGTLKRLTVLNLENCRNLCCFPSGIESVCLKILILSGCSKVDKLPEDLGNIKTLVELRADGTAIKQLPPSIVSLNNLEVLSFARHEETSSKSWSSIFWPLSLLRKSHCPTAFALPSLSGLQLMKSLDVSHCNLSAARLEEISSLTLLEKLNLSGNDFDSLPEDLSKLSRLKVLGLVGCKKLQSFPELPSNIIMIDASNCTSLQEVPKLSTMNETSNLRYDFSNCPKLVENQTIESLTSMMLPQGRIDPYRVFNVFLPGSRVPGWFIDRSLGDCVRLKLPPNWSFRKWKAIATCAVLSPNNPNGCKGRLFEVGYTVRGSNNALLCGTSLQSRIFPNEMRYFESDQVWLSYMIPRPRWALKWEKATNDIDVSFEIFGINCKVKACGVRLLWEEDEGEGSSRTIKWLSSTNH